MRTTLKPFSLVLGITLVVAGLSGALLRPAAPESADISIPGSQLSQQEIIKEDTAKEAEKTTTPTVQETDDTVVPAPDQRPKPASEKQQAVRDSVADEKTYFPLLTANDPGYAASWPLVSMNAAEAWDTTTGSEDTIIAVIDSGFSLAHEDLVDSWATNDAETGMTQLGDSCWTGTPQNKQTNNCDDDSNGYIDDWRGWNFVLGDNNPAAGRQNPSGNGVAHGTQVAGLAGAAGNNSTGIATLSWSTKVMPLQALTDAGPGFTSDVAAAVYYAVDNGATVINMSLGGTDYDPALEAATTYAYENGVPVVAAAGNCGTGNEQGCTGFGAGFITYPARNPYVIAVGAVTQSQQRASFSSYGSALDVVAPGSGTMNSPTWTVGNATSLYSAELYGTSFASPYVASLVALIQSIRPNTSVDDILALVMATTSKPAGMSGAPYTTQFGHGIVNASQAITVASGLAGSSTEPTLWQAGGVRSEHSYDTTSSLGSGCSTTEVSSYCTVRMRNDDQHDRYLPYSLVGDATSAGWTWSAGILGTDFWTVTAVQGEQQSLPYTLSRK